MSREGDFGEHLMACAGDGVDVSVPVPQRVRVGEPEEPTIEDALAHAETQRATDEERTLAAEIHDLRLKLAEAERQRDNEAAAAIGALRLVSDIRFALGDNGRRMQDELVAWCKEIAADTERLDWLQSNFVVFTIDHPTLRRRPIRPVIDAARAQEGAAQT